MYLWFHQSGFFSQTNFQSNFVIVRNDIAHLIYLPTETQGLAQYSLFLSPSSCVLSNFLMGRIFPWNFFVLKLFYELVRFMTENHHCLFPNNLGPNIVRKDSFSGHSSGNTFYHEKPGKALFFLYFPKTQNKIT